MEASHGGSCRVCAGVVAKSSRNQGQSHARMDSGLLLEPCASQPRITAKHILP